MKVQCPNCREIIDMERFSTSDDGLRFACPDCLKRNFLPNPVKEACRMETKAVANVRNEAQTVPSNQSETSPAAGALERSGRSATMSGSSSVNAELSGSSDDEVICPKCGHAQTDKEACHVCGLSFSLFDPARMEPDPPEAKALWDQVLEAPDDLHLHDGFVDACNKADRFDYAHRQYRIFERETGMAEVAETMRYRIQELAQIQLSAFDLTPVAGDGGAARRRKVLWVIVAIIGLIWLAYVVMDSLAVFK